MIHPRPQSDEKVQNMADKNKCSRHRGKQPPGASNKQRDREAVVRAVAAEARARAAVAEARAAEVAAAEARARADVAEEQTRAAGALAARAAEEARVARRPDLPPWLGMI